MRFLAFAAVLAAVTGAAAAGNVPAPGFDCTKAKSAEEKLICSDTGLAAADAALTAVYGKIVSANPEYASGLRDGQRSFLGTRASCLAGKREAQIACLKNLYLRRQENLGGPLLLACARPKMAGLAFTMNCVAPGNPLKLSLAMAGNKEGGEAHLSTLQITSARGKPHVFKLDGQIFFDGLTAAAELMDVNFDGYADVKLATSTSAGPNMGYDYYLYVPATGRFTASKLGDQLSGFDVMPDAKTRTIKVTGRSSCCAWNTSTYAWKGATLVLRTSEDSGEFSPTDVPGVEALDQMFCGRETKHFNDAGLITRIDIATGPGPTTDWECSKDAMADENKLLAKLKGGKGFRIDLSKITGSFAIIFDKPRKPQY